MKTQKIHDDNRPLKWKPIVNCRNNFPKPKELLKKSESFALGKCEVEESAKLLVEFFAKTGIGEWRYFTLEELSAFCAGKGLRSVGAALFGIISGWDDDGGVGCFRDPFPYIGQLNNEFFYITDYFISRLVGSTK